MDNFNPNKKHVKQIANFACIFKSNSTYKTFKAVILSLMNFRNNKQVDFARCANKTHSAIQYFYSKAKWCFVKLNKFRLRFLRNKKEFRDRETDITIFDESKTVKDKNSSFSGLIQNIYDTKKQTKCKGFSFFAASVFTKEHKKKYLLDIVLFIQSRWNSYWRCWIDFARKISKVTKSKVWVFDRGFNNRFLMKEVFEELKKIFVLRISINRLVLADKNNLSRQKQKKKTGRKKLYPEKQEKKIQDIIKKQKPIKTTEGDLHIIENVIIKSWLKVLEIPCSIIVFKRKKFMTPLVIIVSKQELMQKEAIKYIQVYINRWSIETIFKEIKQWFDFEKFKVITEEAIYRYIHLSIFAHTLLSENIISITKKLKLLIENVLKKTRNIKKLTISSLKIFLEMVNKGQLNSFGFMPYFKL
jgi:hypothetical protein